MKLGISLFNQGDPELVGIGAMPVEGRLRLRVIRNSCVYNHILPTAVLKELENGETVFETVVDDKILQEIAMSRKD